jgi:hypothetical protein
MEDGSQPGNAARERRMPHSPGIHPRVPEKIEENVREDDRPEHHPPEEGCPASGHDRRENGRERPMRKMNERSRSATDH